MKSPLVSIAMSVYNGAADAPAAIRSILAQTFEDFELIAVDNGSFKDDTRAVLRALAAEDRRIRVAELDVNIGLAGALNHAISLARGQFIARQDHDDLARPERLALQVAHMQANPDCGLLGTRAEIWVGDAPTGRAHDHPLDDATLKFDLLINNPFVHSSVMIRRSTLEDVGVYATDPERQPPEDFELWSRIARRHRVANLSQRLVIYRETPGSMSREGPNPFRERLLMLAAENIAHWAGLAAPDTPCRDAAALSHAAYDRLSPDAEIEAICAVYEAAAQGIASACPGADLADRRAGARANLRHHFMMARGAPWTVSMIERSRRLPIPSVLRRWLRGRVSG